MLKFNLILYILIFILIKYVIILETPFYSLNYRFNYILTGLIEHYYTFIVVKRHILSFIVFLKTYHKLKHD